MKKSVVSPGRVFLTLLLLAGLAGCVMSNQPVDRPPEDALSYEQLLANLDTLEGPTTRSLAEPSQTVFTLPSGGRLSTRDLSTYLGAIRNDLAGYVYASTKGKPYLVVPVRLCWGSLSRAGGLESGLMWVPFTWGQPLSFPVISYQHGTQVYRETAPSRFKANPLSVLASPDLTGALQNYVECVVGALMASVGYVVVMPDYIGFGDSEQVHPFVTMELGESVAGILGAAQAALTGRAVSLGEEVFLTGYSEGGYATMAGALALQAAETRLAGVVPCAGPYDLSGTMLNQMLTEKVKVPSYLLYSMSGYQALYGEVVNWEGMLTDGYAADLAFFNGAYTNAQIAALGLSSRPREMLTDTAVATLLAPDGTVYNLLADNDGWQGWSKDLPLPVFVHCPLDEVVPVGNAEAARDALEQMLGETAQIVRVPPVPFLDLVAGSVHVAAYPTAMLAAFSIIHGEH